MTDVSTLTDTMLAVGTDAQKAAMKALTDVVEAAVGNSTDDREKTVALAGAIAFTRFKLDMAMVGIRKAFPEYGRLIDGVAATAIDQFGATHEREMADLARKFNIHYPSAAHGDGDAAA